jgi:hypothetical protein
MSHPMPVPQNAVLTTTGSLVALCTTRDPLTIIYMSDVKSEWLIVVAALQIAAGK